MRSFILFLFLTGMVAFAAEPTADYIVTEKNQPLSRLGNITCSASHYTWTGILSEEKQHQVKTVKAVNSQPLENRISIRKDKVMIDNDEFKILSDSKNELVAVYVDGHNIITVQVLFSLAKIVYHRTFFNLNFGKNNFTGWVGSCKNTLN